MKASGTHRGIKWEVEVASLATVTAEGKSVTRRFEDWPTEEQLAILAGQHIDRSVDGLPPIDVPPVLGPGDAPKVKRKR